MKPSLIKKILTAPALRLDELKVGDRIQGFEAWGCVPDNATRTVMSDGDRLCVACKEGVHMLDGQLCDDGQHLLGMCRA